jgi:hypothetical protein
VAQHQLLAHGAQFPPTPAFSQEASLQTAFVKILQRHAFPRLSQEIDGENGRYCADIAPQQIRLKETS